jgi:hypothetical protein
MTPDSASAVVRSRNRRYEESRNSVSFKTSTRCSSLAIVVATSPLVGRGGCSLLQMAICEAEAAPDFAALLLCWPAPTPTRNGVPAPVTPPQGEDFPHRAFD